MKYEDVRRLHSEHPTWHAQRIADSLGCPTVNVRSAAARMDLPIPHSPPGQKRKNMALGPKLFRQRKKQGLTRIEVAEQVGCHRNTIERIDMGNDASYLTVVAYATALGYRVSLWKKP